MCVSGDEINTTKVHTQLVHMYRAPIIPQKDELSHIKQYKSKQ